MGIFLGFFLLFGIVSGAIYLYLKLDLLDRKIELEKLEMNAEAEEKNGP